jgi:thiol-disulfide isomerase/thioredoxin
MKKLLITLLFITASLHFAHAENVVRPYQKGNWKPLTQAYAGQPLVVHFWGVTCAPCAKEMPEWGKFLSQNKNAKIIFIQVDDVPVESVAKMLSAAGLSAANDYTLSAPFDDALRYEIDPRWRGETPMTLLINKNGKVIRKLGSIDFDQLKQWYLSAI